MSEIAYGQPTGFEWGANERASGEFAKCFGDGDIATYVDKGIELLPRDQWVDGTGVDDFVEWIRKQLDGMCASNGAVSALEIARAIAGQKLIRLSAEDLYDHVGRWGTGSTLGDNIRTLSEIGVRTQEQAPTGRNNWLPSRSGDWKADARQNRIHEAIDLGGNFEAVVTALHLRYVCFIGLSWPGGGGHAVCCTSYNNGNLRGPNSWGASYGDKGFYKLTERECVRGRMKSFGAFAIRAATESD
ncbi:hypothetical protein LCGC14_2998090, partial [marine sediment metagenome]